MLVETLITYFKAGNKTKKTPSGWISGNARCCQYNGHSADNRGRGGIIANPQGGISYHCFNCGFKATWAPGHLLSYKMKKLLSWLGVPDHEINKIALDIFRNNNGVEVERRTTLLPSFKEIDLPKDSIRISEIIEFNENNIPVIDFIAKRNLTLDDTDYYWSSNKQYQDRLIIPFYYETKIVGWTARTYHSDKHPKYISERQPGYVYGLDCQTYNKDIVVVCEGEIDAIHVQGCSLGGSEVSEQQKMMLEQLNKRIVVVPDRDKSGSRLVQTSIENKWSVSLPDWNKQVNDISDAVSIYGRLYTLYSIVKSAEDSPLKIKLRAKKWFP